MKIEQVDDAPSTPNKLKHPNSFSRELVLQYLYMQELNENAEPFISSTLFAQKLYETVIINKSTFDATITKLADNWHISRIATVEKNILRLAMAELKAFPNTPFNVVIDEAVELAKLFSNKEAGAFVNGILDQLKPIISTHSN
jgi:N utilization substance protein B